MRHEEKEKEKGCLTFVCASDQAAVMTPTVNSTTAVT